MIAEARGAFQTQAGPDVLVGEAILVPMVLAISQAGLPQPWEI